MSVGSSVFFFFFFLLSTFIRPFYASRKADKVSKAEKDKTWKKSSSSLHSPSSAKSFDAQIANWRMESIVRESESGSDDEFFDCQGIFTHRTAL